MTERNQDFEMFQGESKILEVTEKNGKDISGLSIEWILADEVEDASEITKSTSGAGITITDGPNGKFEVKLDPSDTDSISGRFYHECRLDEGSSDESVLFTGEAIIHRSATN